MNIVRDKPDPNEQELGTERVFYSQLWLSTGCGGRQQGRQHIEYLSKIIVRVLVCPLLLTARKGATSTHTVGTVAFKKKELGGIGVKN